ncbi:hypothetical protein DVA67_007775 [Solirubrobacter sp. CPCC 204708]|uniref:PH domain-containing protein n=1 Tax=Solirubrobacter deserti TaxID=2282478 RepID=A0ABT4RJQ5_9ACTN|nr:hypothetical protein [Solirubrobacter deserti]MBE2315870.1 hypothetical protein [Solirubrobacter deserti]MDA0138792.1 hypothetical protein [Solirubrobacter deserti]
MSNRQSPNARLVGRGRLLAVPIWLYLGLIGVAVLVFGGISMSLVIGIPFTLLALFGLASIAYARVWVDGPTLYSRHVFGYREPIRMDELLRAELTGFERYRGRQLWLTRADGKRVVLDATNLRLKPLYGELARYIPAGSSTANPLLHKRMEAARPIIAVPPPSAATESSWTT